MASPTMLVTLIITAVDAQARAISCIARAYATTPAPEPPSSSGTLIPMRPRSASPRMISRGNRSSASMAAAWGATTRDAKSRAVFWTRACVSVSSRCKAGRWPRRVLRPSGADGPEARQVAGADVPRVDDLAAVGRHEDVRVGLRGHQGGRAAGHREVLGLHVGAAVVGAGLVVVVVDGLGAAGGREVLPHQQPEVARHPEHPARGRYLDPLVVADDADALHGDVRVVRPVGVVG